ncbi:FkbM family methyltransferase [Alteriqipengyuania lutimaris]|nr:FkbM family methyltransferase [Alteriqipengyuania lutimaris]MBB3034347.1 FkbM family methyltransferase [Alteriqipengyuania lutimaris]
MTPTIDKLLKAGASLPRRMWRRSLRYGVAPAIEHLRAIEIARPASLIDIGANKGQFSAAVRGLFPEARIIAFEPLESEAKLYRQVFRGERDVTLHPVAIAEEAGTSTFHVADRADSSSLLKIEQAQTDAFGVRESSEITVQLKRLDECIDLGQLPRPILVKIDVQGAEGSVLRGIDDFSVIDFVYVELSFVTLYEQQPLASEIIELLRSKGLELQGVFNQVTTDRFGPTQADFLFGHVAG